MINGNRVLAVIPARGGSKRLPRKNIRELAGKPLIAWTIEEAKKSAFIDQVILSSEDEEIINVSKSWGCDVPFIRPAELAEDGIPGIDPVLHAVDRVPGYQYVVLLQPTSPLRTVRDIDGCIQKCVEQRASVCVTVTEMQKSMSWVCTLDDHHHMHPITIETQNKKPLQNFYTINGAVYVANVDWLKQKKTFLASETIAHVMPIERSIDVDTEFDFTLCDLFLRAR